MIFQLYNTFKIPRRAKIYYDNFSTVRFLWSTDQLTNQFKKAIFYLIILFYRRSNEPNRCKLMLNINCLQMQS